MKMYRKLVLVCLLLMVSNFSLAASSDKIGPRLLQKLNESSASLAGRVQEQTIPVIVEFVGKMNLHGLKGNKKNRRREMLRQLKDQHQVSRRSIRRLMRQYGITRIDSLLLINGLSFDAPRTLIDDLVLEPSVKQIRLDYQILAPGSGTGGTAPAEWNLNRIGAPTLWGLGVTGLGIVVANMDTGVDFNHSELATAWRGGGNSWYDPHCQPAPWDNPVLFQQAGSCPANTDFSVPRDRAGGSTGHGSKTMGVMVGGDASGTAIGVAPDAKWIASKIFDDNGAASLTAIHKAFAWFLDPDNDPLTDDAPDIVNASWVLGGSDVNGCVLEFQADLQVLRTADIAVVFAAGNEGGSGNPNTSTSPSNNPEGYAVGAIDSADRAAGFSSRGPGPIGTVCETGFFPELVAPGVSVKTTNKNSIPTIDSYSTVSGTSFAAPHVAGAMALLLDALPNLSVSELEMALKDTAQQTFSVDDAMGPDDIYGHGVLNVEGAYYSLCPINGIDSDSDGIPDICDNCINVPNGPNLNNDLGGVIQRDTDEDGFGNLCDADLNNSYSAAPATDIVNVFDISVFQAEWTQQNVNSDADFNGDGSVNVFDISILQSLFGYAPGPSGLIP